MSRTLAEELDSWGISYRTAGDPDEPKRALGAWLYFNNHCIGFADDQQAWALIAMLEHFQEEVDPPSRDDPEDYPEEAI